MLLLITKGDIQSMEQETSANQIGLYKNLIKRQIFDYSDEIEFRLPLLNCLNILKYIWWLRNSDL